MKAIIVEDNAQAASTIKHYLGEYPRPITLCGIAASLDEARAMILKERPEIWLLDIRLHDQEIFTLLDEFREKDKRLLHQAAIVFLTGFSEPEYYQKAFRHAAVNYLLKPVDRERFFDSMDKALQHLPGDALAARIEALESILRESRDNLIMVGIANRQQLIRNKRDITYIVDKKGIKEFYFRDAGPIKSTTNLSLTQWLDVLGSRFVKARKETIINLDQIERIDKKDRCVYFAVKTSVTCTRDFFSGICDAFTPA